MREADPRLTRLPRIVAEEFTLAAHREPVLSVWMQVPPSTGVRRGELPGRRAVDIVAAAAPSDNADKQ